MKKNIIIFKPEIARKLLKNNNQLIDIKPHKDNFLKTVFVFKKTEKLLKELELLRKK